MLDGLISLHDKIKQKRGKDDCSTMACAIKESKRTQRGSSLYPVGSDAIRVIEMAGVVQEPPLHRSSTLWYQSGGRGFKYQSRGHGFESYPGPFHY